MKSIIITVAFLVAAIQAGPLVKEDSGKNETLPVSTAEKNVTHSAVSRSKRDCGVPDLDKIQAKITEALEKQIKQLLGGHIPESGTKTRRATSEAAATSKVEPDGTVKSLAAAKGSNDPPLPEPVLTNGHQIPPVDPSKKILPGESGIGASGMGEGELPPPPPPGGEPLPALPAQAPGAGNTVQKVASKANMDRGTAVASAIAKRAAVLQTVDTSGGKAIANAEAHKGADTNIQSVSANGTHVGIASALVDNKNASHDAMHTGPEVVVQNVAATGAKAVATATNNKGSGNSVQDAMAIGDEISVASVVSSRIKREIIVTSHDDVTVPVEEEDDGKYRPDKDEDDGSYKPDNEDDELIRKRVTRSPCISTKMDDNLRKLIHDTVATAFADLKKELKL